MNRVYVLRLANQCFYIGKTKRPVQARALEHILSRGSAWTRLHPVINKDPVVEVFEDVGFMELSVTLQYMDKYGIDKVRGADYVLPRLPKPQIEEIRRHLLFEKGGCFKCGDLGHYVKDCKEKESFFAKMSATFFAFLSWFKSDCSKKDGGDSVVTFGKHIDKTYQDVYDNNRSYCEWIASQESTRGDFKRFQEWINSRS